jgi:hypothetical protein
LEIGKEVASFYVEGKASFKRLSSNIYFQENQKSHGKLFYCDYEFHKIRRINVVVGNGRNISAVRRISPDNKEGGRNNFVSKSFRENFAAPHYNDLQI